MFDICARNLVVILVALVAGVTAWVFGGTRGDLLPYFLPGLTAMLLEAVLFFPQCREGETQSAARERVWREMRRDPLVWVSVAFAVLLLVPFFNKGLCPACDAAAIAAGARAEPPVPFLPFCVNRLHHLNVVLWFVPALVSLVAVRHALRRRARRQLLEILVWNGVALGVLGFVQQLTHAQGPLWEPLVQSKAFFFSVFGYANMGGDYFAFLFIVSLALWRRRCDEDFASAGRRSAFGGLLVRNYMLLASLALLAAAFGTRSRSAVFLSAAGGGTVLVHAGFVALARMPPLKRVKAAAIVLLAVVCTVFAVMHILPASVRREVAGTSLREITSRVSGRSEYHSRVAFDVFAEHPLFGVGGWGYKHFSLPKTPKVMAEQFHYWWATGGINVHNDYLQFLCEHGFAGFGLFAAVLVLALLPPLRSWWRLGEAVHAAPPRDLPRPCEFFVFPCAPFALLVAAGATLLHAMGDCPLRSPAVLFQLFVVLAAIDGFVPRLSALTTGIKKGHHHHAAR